MNRLFGVCGVAIMIASIVVAGLWIFAPVGINFEPILALLGLLYAAVPITGNWLLNRLNRNLEKEQLSISYALAYGYVHNFLVPVVRRLRKLAEDPGSVRFEVFIPRNLEELSGESIEDIIDDLEKRSCTIETIELDFPGQKRRQDIRSARKSLVDDKDGRQTVYFDFPTTLRTLEPVIDFKLAKSGESPDERIQSEAPLKSRRAEIGREYISHFRQYLIEILSEPQFEQIRKNINIPDSAGEFLRDRMRES